MLMVSLSQSLLGESSCIGRTATAWKCTMCGCNYSKPKPADADRGRVTLTSAASPKIIAKKDICVHDELSSQPTSTPIPGPDIAYRRP